MYKEIETALHLYDRMTECGQGVLTEYKCWNNNAQSEPREMGGSKDDIIKILVQMRYERCETTKERWEIFGMHVVHGVYPSKYGCVKARFAEILCEVSYMSVLCKKSIPAASNVGITCANSRDDHCGKVDL